MNIRRFSGYWHVEGNPKKNQGKHLLKIGRKNFNLFFSEDPVEGSFKNILIKKNQLESTQYNKNLKNSIFKEKNCFTKFSQKIEGEVFYELSSIWTNKILLFQQAYRNYPNSDYIMWIDCVKNANLQAITDSNSDLISINKYNGRGTSKMKKEPFGNFLGKGSKHFKKLDKFLLAQVIKIPTNRVREVVEIYKKVLNFVDQNYNIYDEEVVLSEMYYKYSKLFNIINDA
jgi:hypothetical protein